MQINNTPYIQKFSIGQLFRKEGDKFLIPIYQRNYEWESGQIVQLLEDIRDYYIYDTEDSKNYYIGTLIVNARDISGQIIYETIDGQQRLTTLNIIVAVLRYLHSNNIIDKLPQGVDYSRANIGFESRPIAEKTVDYIFRNGTEQPNFKNFNENIFEAVKIVNKKLLDIKENFEKGHKESQKSFDEFITYLFEKVILLRVQVPENTDMNHYFEIMNSRGEQLERHEILKAELMSRFTGVEHQNLRKAINLTWQACSRMDSYVQMGIPKNLRSQLFGGRWFQLLPKNQEELFSVLEEFYKGANEINSVTFDDIIKADPEGIEEIKKNLEEEGTRLEEDAEYRQFQEVINFENFLLHVLKLTLAELQIDTNVSLDDKKLIDFLKEALKKVDDKTCLAKTFIYNLLKSRFLLDQFVLKRKYVSQKDEWSLNALKFYPAGENGRKQDTYSYINSFENAEENRELILLLSMFHVSTPTLSYKNWLYEVLRYLSSNYDFDKNDLQLEYQNNIDSSNYIDALRTIAVKFLKYYALNGDENLSYEEMLDEDRLKNADTSFDKNRLTYGEIKTNLVFNFIDYLLWKKNALPDKLVSDFEFSFRSSVEHYYPQAPRTIERIEDPEILNSIGNLCLISHNNNSKLSNHSPAEKRKYYKNSKSKDSIKQMVMMEKGDDWNKEEIKNHTNEIHELLQKVVFEDYPITKLNGIYKKESNATFLYKADEE